MAKKPTSADPKTPAVTNPAKVAVVTTAPAEKTAVRKTTVPKSAAAAEIVVAPSTPGTTTVASDGKKTITNEMIADRAYYLAHNGHHGSQDDHWHQAERELRAELG